MGVRRGRKTGICPPWILGLRTKFSKKAEVSSLIDVILAMTVLFADMTVTLHKSRVHSYGIMQ